MDWTDATHLAAMVRQRLRVVGYPIERTNQMVQIDWEKDLGYNVKPSAFPRNPFDTSAVRIALRHEKARLRLQKQRLEKEA